jgi:hypothetical protein
VVVDFVKACTLGVVVGVDKVVDDPICTKVSVLVVVEEPTSVNVTVLSLVLLDEPNRNVDEGGETVLKPVAIGWNE